MKNTLNIIKQTQLLENTLRRIYNLSCCIYYSHHTKGYIPTHDIHRTDVYERMFLIQEYLGKLGYSALDLITEG